MHLSSHEGWALSKFVFGLPHFFFEAPEFILYVAHTVTSQSDAAIRVSAASLHSALLGIWALSPSRSLTCLTEVLQGEKERGKGTFCMLPWKEGWDTMRNWPQQGIFEHWIYSTHPLTILMCIWTERSKLIALSSLYYNLLKMNEYVCFTPMKKFSHSCNK